MAAVFVKGVVRRFHAASLISGALISVSGLSQTGPAGCQLRVLPDQRSGFCVLWRGFSRLADLVIGFEAALRPDDSKRPV